MARRAALVAALAAAALGACAQVLGIETFQGGSDPACAADAGPSACGACCTSTRVTTLPPLAPGEPVTIDGTTAKGESHFTFDLASSDANGFGCTSADGPEDVYAVSAAAKGILTATLLRSDTTFDGVLYARQSCCEEQSMVLCADSTGCSGPLDGGDVLSFPVDAGETWYLVVDGRTAGDHGNYKLRLRVDRGTSCAEKVALPVEPGSPFVVIGDNDVAASMPGDVLDHSAVYTCPGGSTVNGLGGATIYDVTGPRVSSIDFHVSNTKNSCDKASKCPGAPFDTVLYASAKDSKNPCGGFDNVVQGVSYEACKDNNAEKGCTTESGETIGIAQGSAYVFVDSDTPASCCGSTGGRFFLQVVPHAASEDCATVKPDACPTPQDGGTDLVDGG